jgi:hypothetical protein
MKKHNEPSQASSLKEERVDAWRHELLVYNRLPSILVRAPHLVNIIFFKYQKTIKIIENVLSPSGLAAMQNPKALPNRLGRLESSGHVKPKRLGSDSHV